MCKLPAVSRKSYSITFIRLLQTLITVRLVIYSPCPAAEGTEGRTARELYVNSPYEYYNELLIVATLQMKSTLYGLVRTGSICTMCSSRVERREDECYWGH